MALLRFDNFNRSDGPIGSPSDGGSGYLGALGSFSIFDSKLQHDSGDPAVRVLEAGVSDMLVESPMGAPSGSTVAGLTFRYVDDNNFLMLLWNAYAPSFQFWQRVAGTNTKIGTDLGGSYSAFNTVAVNAVGSTLQAFVNGVQVGTDRTSSTHIGGTKAGVYSGGSIMSWNELSISDAISAAAPLSLPTRRRIFLPTIIATH